MYVRLCVLVQTELHGFDVERSLKRVCLWKQCVCFELKISDE